MPKDTWNGDNKNKIWRDYIKSALGIVGFTFVVLIICMFAINKSIIEISFLVLHPTMEKSVYRLENVKNIFFNIW